MTAAVSFATPEAVVAAIGRAASVELSAYMLEPRGAMTRALEAAADRGADVRVTLEPFAERGRADGLRRLAGIETADLRAHGVTVRLGVPGGDTVHLKAAVVDGTAYLDDRNWTAGDETIVALAAAADVAAVHDAIGGRTVATERLATEKDPALALEAAAIREGTGDCVEVQSESFGAGAISAALRVRAATGSHVRLLVNRQIALGAGAKRERAVLHGLAAAGVEIRTTRSTEKLCVAGERGWVGSANATFDAVPTTDWGLALRGGPMLGVVDTTFRSTWDAARPFT